jgi:hypothetical protein
MSESVARMLAQVRTDTHSDGELVRMLAVIWSDPGSRAVLSGSTEFVRERIEHFGRRGYLTPRERQGIRRTLFAGAAPLSARLSAWEPGSG